jgi:hypothetical protein
MSGRARMKADSTKRSHSISPRSERRPLQPIVSAALSAAEIELGGPVCLSEIIDYISQDDQRHISQRFAKSEFRQAVHNLLGALCDVGGVWTDGAQARARRYASVRRGSTPESAVADSVLSRRQATLRLVRAAVASHGRAVRICDVAAIAWPDGAPAESMSGISHAMASLAQTGELSITGHVRGGGLDGSTLYLPSDTDPSSFSARGPLSALERVAHAFDCVWNEEVRDAKLKGRLPRPIPSRRVRERIHATAPEDEILAEKVTLGNLMCRLEGTAADSLRIARRSVSHIACLWAPADTGDDELDLEGAYASDSERIIEAARRAQAMSDAPTIGQRAVVVQCEADDDLRVTQAKSVRHVLYDLSRETVSQGIFGPGRPRVTQNILFVGRVARDKHYVVRLANDGDDVWKDRITTARVYQAAEVIRREMVDLRISLEIDNAGNQREDALALGRLRTCASMLDQFQRRVDDLIDRNTRDAAEIAKSLRENLVGLQQRIAEKSVDVLARPTLRRDHLGDLLTTLDERIIGWTAQELGSVWGMLDASKAGKTGTKLISQLGPRIRRFRNPDYQAHHLGGRDGAEYLFERTSSLLYLAQRYGGRECVMLAALAYHALGLLRDERFAAQCVFNPDADVRLAGIACLAFLRGPSALSCIERAIEREPSDRVRASALWAYAFADGENPGRLASPFVQCGQVRLQNMARAILEPGFNAWRV